MITLTRKQQQVLAFFEQTPVEPRTLSMLLGDSDSIDWMNDAARTVQGLLAQGKLSGWGCLMGDPYGYGPPRQYYSDARLLPTSRAVFEQLHIDLDQGAYKRSLSLSVWASHLLYQPGPLGDLERTLLGRTMRTTRLDRARTWLGMLLTKPSSAGCVYCPRPHAWRVGEQVAPAHGSDVVLCIGSASISRYGREWTVTDNNFEQVLEACRKEIWATSPRS